MTTYSQKITLNSSNFICYIYSYDFMIHLRKTIKILCEKKNNFAIALLNQSNADEQTKTQTKVIQKHVCGCEHFD